jgi:hypothetical protein
VARRDLLVGGMEANGCVPAGSSADRSDMTVACAALLGER